MLGCLFEELGSGYEVFCFAFRLVMSRWGVVSVGLFEVVALGFGFVVLGLVMFREVLTFSFFIPF